MKRRNILITTMIFALASASSTAEEINISTIEMKNLGISLGSPQIAREVAAVEATARVVIPPTGDTVVSAPIPGLLASLGVSVGEEVTRNQVIARLQSADFLALQGEFLDALNVNLLAQNEFTRDRQLLEEGIISGRRLQETTTRAKIAAASFNQHRQLLQTVGLSDSDIRTLETRQEFLQALEVRAPFDGVILERMANIGERLGAMSPVYRLADLTSLWLEINVAQEDLAAVRPGMKVAVAGSPVLYPGVVTTIGRSVDPASQVITVRATLVEADHGLRPGQMVSARIVADSTDTLQEDIWMVPVTAVTRSGDNHFLFVRTANGFDIRQARVIGADSNRIFLSADVDADSNIAIDGVSALKALWQTQAESES